MKKSLFTRGVILGAIVGGALSLFHEPTRKNVVGKVTSASKTVYHYATSPEEIIEGITEKKEKVMNTYESISKDVYFILDKINEFKEYKNS